jgi:hypothetical protein
MIRIDEIYNNVFAPIVLSKPNQSVHYFDPFGKTDFNSLKVIPLINNRERVFLFWDQEPYFPEVHDSTINKFINTFTYCPMFSYLLMNYDTNIFKPLSFKHNSKVTSITKIKNAQTTIVTSERNSENIDNLIQKHGFDVSYYFFHAWAALDWYRGYNRTFLIAPFRERTIKNTFICPNRVVSGKREHRIKLFKRIVQNNLIGNNKISFPSKCPYNNEPIHIPGVQLPLVFDQEGEDNIPNESYKISLWEQSKESLVSVVTETVYKEKTLHLTEKTFKPIVMQLPFILVAPKHSLEYLRSYGFKTFGDLWDEDYDHEDNEHRLESVVKLLHNLNSMSSSEKSQLQKHLVPIVEHNFNWFYSKEFEQTLWVELTNMMSKW